MFFCLQVQYQYNVYKYVKLDFDEKKKDKLSINLLNNEKFFLNLMKLSTVIKLIC